MPSRVGNAVAIRSLLALKNDEKTGYFLFFSSRLLARITKYPKIIIPTATTYKVI